MAVVDHGRPLRSHRFSAAVAAFDGRALTFTGGCLLLRLKGYAPFGGKRVLVDLIFGHLLCLIPTDQQKLTGPRFP